MHGPWADRHVGGWVAARGGEGGAAEAPRCTESRDISHYAFLSGGRHYFTYCRRRRTDCLCQFFHPAKKERPAIWSRSTRIAVRTPPQRWNLTEFDNRLPRLKKRISSRKSKRILELCVCVCVWRGMDLLNIMGEIGCLEKFWFFKCKNFSLTNWRIIYFFKCNIYCYWKFTFQFDFEA